MADSDLGALLVRTIVSLLVVLAIIGIAYVVAKRRAGGGRLATTGGRSALSGARRRQRRSAPNGIEVVGRAGLARGSSVVAVRFGERVLLLGTSESGGAATNLAEMSAADWDEIHTVREPIDDPDDGAGLISTTRPSFVEALRQATSRRG